MIRIKYPYFWQKQNLLSYILLPFGWIYLALGYLRKLLANTAKFDGFTICVGNCTIGGTGKTQAIIALSKMLKKKNINFIILSKGYGGSCSEATLVTSSSSPEEVGDEALELCRYGTTFVIPKMQSAKDIIAKYHPEIILVDDGMQNPYFEKDLVIMTIDGSRGFGNKMPIPAGPMRMMESEVMNNLDIILVNGKLKQKLPYLSSKPLFNASVKAQHNFSSKKYYAFSGIGNNQKFFALLRSLGAKLVHKKGFPDHYHYSNEDLAEIVEKCRKSNLKMITTRKDYVKIKSLCDKNEVSEVMEIVGLPEQKDKLDLSMLEVLEVELEIENQKDFFDLVLSKYKEYQGSLK